LAKVIFTRRAKSNLRSIGDWIARDNPPRAVTFVGELRDACTGLLDFPSAYPVVAGLAGEPVRKRVFGAYLILYEIEGDDVRILAIVHGARDPDTLLG
jgi:plasmid stabilization system protein ParE